MNRRKFLALCSITTGGAAVAHGMLTGGKPLLGNVSTGVSNGTPVDTRFAITADDGVTPIALESGTDLLGIFQQT